MPLPDERPRQSVQNLIGRFENQTKRQAPNNALLPPPRSSSVVSHHTGESVNHDIKEKREWPPKSISERIASLDSSPFLPRTSLPTSQSAPQPVMPPMISEPQPASLVEPLNKDQGLSTTPERKGVAEVPLPKQATPTTPSRITVRSSSTKTSPTAAAASSKPTNRAPRPSIGALTIQPLKPQHTGMSTASIASTKKSGPKPTSTVNHKTPVRPVTATVTSPVMRPKTPSSGLYAPTAASLAKSRSVTSAPMPTPVKKTTLSASSSDRLSKPTAASLSKARALVPPVPPVPATPKQTRSIAKAAAGTLGPPKAGVKAKAPSISKTQPLAKETTPDDASGATNGAVVGAQQLETNGTPDPANGHPVKEQAEDLPAPADPLAEETSGDVEAANVTSKAPSLEQHEPESSIETPAPMTNGDSSHPHTSDTTVVEKDEVAEEPHVDQGDDIENVVSFLENVPAWNGRPVSIAIIPDDVHEIPDEE